MRKFLAFALVSCFAVLAGSARAVPIAVDFVLEIDEAQSSWSLFASTNSPGGIGAIVVDLVNTATGSNVSPRGTSEAGAKGFVIGNANFTNQQAFAALFPVDLESLVYGVGYEPVPNVAFGWNGNEPTFMRGNALIVPTKFYQGTYSPAGPQPNFAPQQSANAAIVYLTPYPAGGYERPVVPDTISYTVRVIPEPSTIALALLSVPAFFALRRRPR